MTDSDKGDQQDRKPFSCLGREWTVPVKQRLSHKVALRDGFRSPYVDTDALMCEVFLTPAEWATLREIDPDEDDLSAMAEAIGKTMGLGGSGNS